MTEVAAAVVLAAADAAVVDDWAKAPVTERRESKRVRDNGDIVAMINGQKMMKMLNKLVWCDGD